MNLINRDKVLKTIPSEEMVARMAVMSAPVVDAIPVRHGKWRHYEGTLTCSECGTMFYDDIMEYCGDAVPRHCPECGADMRGEKE